MSKSYSYYFEEVMFKFSLTKEQGIDTCPWLESEEFPPLSPRKAIALAKKELLKMLAEYPYAEPTLDACSLKRISEHEENCGWYYDVEWMVWPPEVGDKSSINVPVMLNGEIPPYEEYQYKDRFDAWQN